MTQLQTETLEAVGHRPISAADLHARDHWSVGAKTISRQLGELYKLGLLDRRWRGNERFGHFVYFRKDGAEGGAK